MTFRELWESKPLFNILDKLKIGDGIYEVVAVEVSRKCDPATDGVISLRPCHGTEFIPDADDCDSEADYYRVPLSLLKAARPLVSGFQEPVFAGEGD